MKIDPFTRSTICRVAHDFALVLENAKAQGASEDRLREFADLCLEKFRQDQQGTFPAYVDTLVGELATAIDAHRKALGRRIS